MYLLMFVFVCVAVFIIGWGGGGVMRRIFQTLRTHLAAKDCGGVDATVKTQFSSLVQQQFSHWLGTLLV